MRKIFKKSIAYALAASFLLNTSMCTFAKNSTAISTINTTTVSPPPPPSTDDILIDGFIKKPLDIISMLLGTGVFIVTLPFSALGGDTNEVSKTLIEKPAKSAFERCLGCLPPAKTELIQLD